jgi:flagellum-specific ATP synthase
MTLRHVARWHAYLHRCAGAVTGVNTLRTSGYLTRVAGLVMEAVGLRLAVGSGCIVRLPDGRDVQAEVVGFSGEKLYLMPAHDVYGLSPGARVDPVEAHAMPATAAQPGGSQPGAKHLPVGTQLLGRVVDGTGEPLDRLGALATGERVSLQSRPINPLERKPIGEVLDVGVRAINAMLTVGRGQRMGLFAGSGVGKSVLLGMMARYTAADVIVVGLIGERGREVQEFIDRILGPAGLARAVVVAAPADTSPLMRLQGASYATAIAEYFRDRGQHVLLIMDSLTRYAMAQREIALAIGEPPATKGYPPSVFAKLPQLAERAGNGASGRGSVTAFYTVLAEGDDQQDPIADAARAILDGHIVLTRTLSDQGHYPAIDIESSVSRAMSHIVPADHTELVRRFKSLYARYQRSRDLVSVGAYASGTDPELDRAIALYPQMEAFLRQDMHMRESHEASVRALAAVMTAQHAPAAGA